MLQMQHDLDRLPTKTPVPLSISMPAYSKLSHRRRITCRQCGLPFGYVPLGASKLEAQIARMYEVNQMKLLAKYSRDALNTCTSTKHISDSANVSAMNEANAVDDREFLAMFMADAINIRTTKRCVDVQEDNGCTKPVECELPSMFLFHADTIRTADNVYCVGCDTCIGVRFQPICTGPKVCNENRTHCSQYAHRKRVKSVLSSSIPFSEDEDFIDHVKQSEDCPMWGKSLDQGTIQDQGWVSIAIECVRIEPLFGLVGIEQFSIRYEGGEMMPMLHRSIESSPLLSQNSAAWMIPARRSKTARLFDTSKIIQTWSKSFYDLEVDSKALPYTLNHGDLVDASVRRICPIYSRRGQDQT